MSSLTTDSIVRAIEHAKSARALNFLITETFELATQQANSAHKKNVGVFAMVAKDNFAVEGVPMTCASAMLKNYIPTYTATCIQRLLNKGGCLIGKANMDEFAQGSTNYYSHFGPTLHSATKYVQSTNESSKRFIRPRSQAFDQKLEDDYRIAGGSSGGSAVAVAVGAADIAIGSDTGGSSRNPAAFNGIFGFKPSYGRLSRHGLVPLANSFDTPSIFTATATDCLKYFEMMEGSDEMDSTSIDIEDQSFKRQGNFMITGEMNDVRIGVPKEFRTETLSQESEQNWIKAIKTFEQMGAKIVDVSLPHTSHSIICYYILADSEIASNMARYDGVRFGHKTDFCDDSFNEVITRSRSESLNDTVRRRIFAGNFYNVNENRGRYYLQAAKIRRMIKQNYEFVFNTQVDALLTPTTAHHAPLFSELAEMDYETTLKDDFFTQPANVCGLPAISVPFSNSLEGLPLGVQIVCPYGCDKLCISLAIKLAGC